MDAPTIEQLTEAHLFLESHRYFGRKKDISVFADCFDVMHRAITELKRFVFYYDGYEIKSTRETLPPARRIIGELFKGVGDVYFSTSETFLLFDSVNVADKKISDELRNVIRMCAEHKLKVSDVIREIYAVQYRGQKRRICTQIFPKHKGICMNDNDSCPLCRIFPGLAANYFNESIHDIILCASNALSKISATIDCTTIPKVSLNLILLNAMRKLYTKHVNYIKTYGDPDECRTRFEALMTEHVNIESKKFMAMINDICL